jgi:PEP-CTERM motif
VQGVLPQEIYGGVQMKFSSLFLVAMLIAGLVVIAAPSARADGVQDPHIIMNGGGDPPTCDPSTEVCITDANASQDDPVVLSFFNSTKTFVYTGTEDITDLFLLLEGAAVKPGAYDCSGNVFTSDCEGVFEDPTIQNEFPNSLELFATVALTTGESGTITITPEPSTLLLLGLGVVALVGFRRKFGFPGFQA